MSEQEQISQLSALFDGELPPQQAEWAVRRALKDPAMRARWQRYAVIGACVRGEPMAGASQRQSVAARVAARLASEADVLAPRAQGIVRPAGRRGVMGLFGRGAMGGAIAAAVALVAVFGVRSLGPGTDDAGLLVADSKAAAQSRNEPPSYTTPGANSPAASRFVELQPLAHYVVAHSEQAASSFGFSNALTQGAVDMTEDEIEARR